MKTYLRIATILAICLVLIGNIVFATDVSNTTDSLDEKEIIENIETEAVDSEGNETEEGEAYDITLTGNYTYGDEKITLEWTGISDEQPLEIYAQVGDYVDYPITSSKVNNNYNYLNNKIKYTTQMDTSTQWRVIYNDGEIIKLVSTEAVCDTTIRGEDYDWYNANPYSYGDSAGDGGGYGVYYQLDQIAKCFADYNYVSNVRPLDITALPRSNALLNLKNFLNQTETDDISIQIREKGFEEITDTERHGGILGIGGTRNYNSTVATITDTSGLYTGGKFFLPNYYNGEDSLNAVYYVDGTKVKLHRTYKKGKSITAGIKVIVTLKTGLYKIAGDGSKENPWQISTTPGHGKYTVYQKTETNGEFINKVTTSKPYTTLTEAHGVLDTKGPDKPNAELGLIKGDGWNLKLIANSGDQGTDYYHKVIATAGLEQKQYTSNEIHTTITTGVKGYAYCIDNKENTNPDSKIQFIPGEEIKIYRMNINVGKYIHIKAIDYAGNESEVLHMPLVFVFRDLNLYKEYQEAADFSKTGIAQTPGWNYVKIDWNPIEIAKDEPEEMPDVILTVDVSGSMSGSRIKNVRTGATALVNSLLTYYPEMKIGIVAFSNGPSIRAYPTNDKTTLIKAINGLGASGGTDAAGGINTATDLLVKSTQRNHVLIVMTDGYPNSGSATQSALSRAKNNGMKVVSLIIQTNASSLFAPYSDSLYKVNSSTNELYDTIAYSLYQEIVDTMIAKYYTYREKEGEKEFVIINDEPIIDVEYGDTTATDKAGPTRPLVTLSETADRDGYITMDVWAEDRGTAYEFYVKFVHPRTKDELYSNTVVQEVKTGIQGYAWSITANATDDPGKNVKPLQFKFGPANAGKWLHIRAVDYAGNLGDVCHVKIETSRFITWEELNETEELFCVQYGQTIPARDTENHLNAVVAAGSGQYAIKEVVANPQTGDRIGTRFVEGTMTNIYGTQPIYSYSLGEYVVSLDTPPTRPGKEGNATDQEAYILNFYEENDSLESAVQKAVYSTEVSKGNITWNWDQTEESEALLAEAKAYASYQRKGYEYSNIKLDTTVYMDQKYKDALLGPFILTYDPQGLKYEDKEIYFAKIIGMKIYDQNNNVIAELDENAKNIGNIEVEFIYTGTATASKRNEALFTKEKYKYPVGYEEFYIKIKYEEALDNVTEISKVEFIHNKYDIDARYNVLEGTYNKIRWTPNRVSSVDKDVLWCRETQNGANECIHDKTRTHIVGCYFYLTATVYQSYRNIPSQKLIDVLWVRKGYQNMIQILEPGSGESDPEYPASNEYTNPKWRLVMDIRGNVWNDGMEDQNNGIKENKESGVEKVKVNIYQINQNAEKTGIEYSTYTDNLGNYALENVKKGIYELEFVYNGQIYISTKLLVNGTAVDYKNDFTHTKYTNNSVSQETTSARQELNSAYEEIAGNSTAIGGRGVIELEYIEDMNISKIQTTTDGYTRSNFEIKALTSTNNIFYPISKRIDIQGDKYIKIVDSKNVNMGLAQRYTTDTSLKMDLYETIFSIKGDKQSYIFSEKNIRDINSTIEKDEYVQEVNRADHDWELQELLNKAPNQETKDRLLEILGSSEQSELEGYLDYIIVIRNSGEKDKVQIAELANYYTKDLVYLTEYRDFDITSWAQVKYEDVREGENRNKTDKIEITWSTTSKYKDNSEKPTYSDEYNKIYTTGLDRKELQVQKGEFLEVHIVFKINKERTGGKLELDENNAGKASMTEINGYKTYYIQDNSIAGLIDIDSQPGNANPREEKEYQEDDEEFAPSLKLKLAETANAGETMDGISPDDINKDENGNIIGYGNILEGNVWEDLKTQGNVQTLINNQVISDGIRQDTENLIQNIKVDLIEYFPHPTDTSKDVYLTLKTQDTRAVLSLSNNQTLEGGYSFINLASGNYKVKFTYGNYEQLLADPKLQYNGQDYQGIATQDIYSKEGTKTTYEHVEIMLVADVSGSMNGNVDNMKNLLNKIQSGIRAKLPNIKIGLTKFNDIAQVILQPDSNETRMQTVISNLGSSNETAIGYGLETATNSYSQTAQQKIMILVTDSEETVQNVEQVIKKIEMATDENQIELTTILTKENSEIFGTEQSPRRGNVYKLYNTEAEQIIKNICTEVIEQSAIENRRSSAKDLEGDIETPGTRAYSINKYQIMTLEKAQKIDTKEILKLTGEERTNAIKTLADETYMQAESKMASFKPNNTKISNIHELNLALMERPLTGLSIETQITAIKVILPDNTVLIDTSKGLSKNVNGLDQEDVPISIYMDEEIMHGSTLIVTYDVKVANKGEIDTLSNYLTGADLSTVTTRAKLVFNYTTKNMLYRDEQTTWDTIDISDIKESVTGQTIQKLKDEDKKVYRTEGFGIELYPEGSKEVLEGTGYSEAHFTVTLSKVIAAENEEVDLTFDSSMEIVERENTAGRRSETETPGNYEPDTTPLESDSIKNRRIIITKPWGENRNTAYLAISMITAIAITSVIGIYLRKNGEKNS